MTCRYGTDLSNTLNEVSVALAYLMNSGVVDNADVLTAMRILVNIVRSHVESDEYYMKIVKESREWAVKNSEEIISCTKQ
jgi:hypothetical protein